MAEMTLYSFDENHQPVAHVGVPAILKAIDEGLLGGDNHIDATQIGDIRISTVFLNHKLHSWVGPPRMFETMVFGGPIDGAVFRYLTWDEAVAGHASVVQQVQDIIDQQN